MTASRPPGSASIAGVLRGDTSDLTLLAWLAEYVQPGDDVHLTVPYRELLVSGLHWSPALRTADAHRDRARQRLSTAVARLRALTDRGAEVDGSIVAARRVELTADLATVADLVVCAVPNDVPARYAFAEAVRCAAGPADLPAGRAGVVLVPEAHVVGRRTVLVPDVGAPRGDVVVAAAADATTRYDGTLRVVEDATRSGADEIRSIGATVGLVVVVAPGVALRSEVSDLIAVMITEFAVPVMVVNDPVPADVPSLPVMAAPIATQP
jgi:hypothetical protein